MAEDGQTVITGPVIDQAHLHGLLDRIGDFGLELVGVNATPSPEPSPRPPAPDRTSRR